MIFAAGLGTRLRGVMPDLPKALVEVAGVPMLERVARRLVEAGADRLIVNTHHHADKIAAFVDERDGFGVETVLSPEPDGPLETGGGLLRAADLFRRDAPFFIHNADIVTDFPLEELYARHLERDSLATLAVMERQSSRSLLFDDRGLIGRIDDGRGVRLLVRDPVGEVVRLGFGGVHVASPTLLDRIAERGVFSILDPYLRLAGEGQIILPHRIDGFLWIDIGKPEQLAVANRTLERSLPPRDSSH